MNFQQELKQVVQALSKDLGKKFTLLPGTVKEVDGETCTVDDYEDVRLNAVIDDLQSQFTIYPKVGSKVIIGRLENEDDAFIVKYSEIDRVAIKIGDLLFEMAGGKFVIKSGQVNLKSILNSAFQQLTQAVITTPAGPGTFSAADIQAFNQYNNQVNQLMADGA